MTGVLQRKFQRVVWRDSKIIVKYFQWMLTLVCWAPFSSWAQPELPYSNRVKAYNGLSTTISGDLDAVGMAGAVTAIADGLVSCNENPAATAMTLDSSGIQLTGISTRDGDIQSYNEKTVRSSIAVGGLIYPWGFTIGYQTLYAEGQVYNSAITHTAFTPDIRLREWRAQVGRSFHDGRYSLGLALIATEGVESLDETEGAAQMPAEHLWALNLAAGVLYRTPTRWLIGASLVLPRTLERGDGPTGPFVTNFSQAITLPLRFSLGGGWIPNRFFKFGASVSLVGTQANTGLLWDQSSEVGNRVTLQPRLGAQYRAIETRFVRLKAMAGGYLEPSRVEGRISRLHFTSGLEVNPWIFSLGWGVDLARDYQNLIGSVSIDLGRLLEGIKLIPRSYRPPAGGILPDPFFPSDAGLPRPLRSSDDPHPGENVIKVGSAIPEKVGDWVNQPEKPLKGLSEDLLDSLKQTGGELQFQRNRRPEEVEKPRVPGPPSLFKKN